MPWLDRCGHDGRSALEPGSMHKQPTKAHCKGQNVSSLLCFLGGMRRTHCPEPVHDLPSRPWA
jgi:hypothetical protein